MRKTRDGDAASILYLASVLPALRERSEEAAALLETAIVECVVSLSGCATAKPDDAELESFLRHALDDNEAISPLGNGLLRRVLDLLGETRLGAPDSRLPLH